MAGSRAPGDITRHVDQTTYSYSYNGGPYTFFQAWKRVSDRPLYPMGPKVTLLGGTQFVKSTAYVHESSELLPTNNYVCRLKVDHWWGTVYPSCDDGREIPALLDYWGANDRLVNGFPNDMRNESVTKALNAIADQKVNIGENLATLGQTTRLLASNSLSLIKALDAMSHNGQFRKWLFKSYRDLIREGIPEVAARKYLEYIYGLKPLMEDTYTLTQLAKETGQLDLLLSGRGVSQRSLHSSSSSWRNLSYSRNRRLSATANAKCKTTLWAQIDPNYSGLRALNQFGLLNPFSLFWEIVPWSFVVDWILPVGPVMSALSAPAGLNFVDGSISLRVSQTTLYDYQGAVVPSGASNETIIEHRSSTVPHVHEGFIRNPITNWPLPGLWIDPDPLRGDRPFKAVALAAVSLGRRKAEISTLG